MSNKEEYAQNGEAPKNAWKTAKRLFKQFKNQRFRMFVIGLCIVFYVFLSIYTPYYSAGVIDSLFQAISSALEEGTPFRLFGTQLGNQMLFLCTMYLFTAIFYHFQGFLAASVAENLILSLREQISGKLHKLPLRFFDENKSGEILSRVTSDLDKVSETLQTGLLKLITAIGTLVGAFAFMFYYSPVLTIIFLLFSAVGLWFTKIISAKNLAAASARQESLAKLTGLAEEYYTGRDVIRAYNREEESMRAVERATNKLQRETEKTDFLLNCVNPLIRLLSRVSQAVVMLIACKRILEGEMTVGVVQAFFQYVNLAAEPLTETSYMINSLQSALASAERTFLFLDEEEERPDCSSPVRLEKAKGEIAFRDVSFGYTSEKLLMKRVDLTAHAGQKIAIVGSTGAGKTTLVNLLMRFYEVNGGEITIDGVSSTMLTRKDLRSNFGMVLQDAWLFDGTIAENIAYGKPNATREEIIAAAKAAKADFFIRSIPQGYDAVLDNESDNLSVGQRQLLTIARVFLYDPPVLILDEATSSVDTRTEREISKAMKALMRNRTSFVIAHRLSTIRDADVILFMENGDVIEQGNHRQLLEKNGAYASLYYSQFA